MDIFTEEPLLLTEQDITRCYQTLGLLFASYRCAQLHIREVPALVEWKLHEYDGQEHVFW